jgi:hypothetical protein
MTSAATAAPERLVASRNPNPSNRENGESDD